MSHTEIVLLSIRQTIDKLIKDELNRNDCIQNNPVEFLNDFDKDKLNKLLIRACNLEEIYKEKYLSELHRKYIEPDRLEQMSNNHNFYDDIVFILRILIREKEKQNVF